MLRARHEIGSEHADQTTATQIPLIPREVHSIQEPSAVSARRCSDDTPFPVTVIADTA